MADPEPLARMRLHLLEIAEAAVALAAKQSVDAPLWSLYAKLLRGTALDPVFGTASTPRNVSPPPPDPPRFNPPAPPSDAATPQISAQTLGSPAPFTNRSA